MVYLRLKIVFRQMYRQLRLLSQILFTFVLFSGLALTMVYLIRRELGTWS